MPWDNDGCCGLSTADGTLSLPDTVKRLAQARNIFSILSNGSRTKGSETSDGGLLVFKREGSDWPYKIVIAINPTDSEMTDVNLWDSCGKGADDDYKDWLTDTEYENNEDGTFTPALNIKPNYGVILIRKDAGNFYQWGTVTGTVSGLDPGTKAIVSIDAPDGASCSAWTVETDENGYYEITRVITGTRYIRWWAQGKKWEGQSTICC